MAPWMGISSPLGTSLLIAGSVNCALLFAEIAENGAVVMDKEYVRV